MSIYLPNLIIDIISHGFHSIKVEIDDNTGLFISANCIKGNHHYYFNFMENNDDLSGGFIYTILFICDDQLLMYEQSYCKREAKYLLRKGFNLIWNRLTRK